MATKTSLRVPLLVLLVVLYLDCSLQGAQASPTGNMLPTWAEKRLEVPESHLAEKTVTVFKGNSTGDPGAGTVVLEYQGLIPPLNATNNNTLAVTYPDNYIIVSISVLTDWLNGGGNITVSDSGHKYNDLAVTWELSPHTFVFYEVNITVITP
jgi:hypothetical protein